MKILKNMLVISVSIFKRTASCLRKLGKSTGIGLRELSRMGSTTQSGGKSQSYREEALISLPDLLIETIDGTVDPLRSELLLPKTPVRQHHNDSWIGD